MSPVHNINILMCEHNINKLMPPVHNIHILRSPVHNIYILRSPVHNICTASHKKQVIVDQHSVPPWRDSSDLFHYFISQRKAEKWPEHFYEVFQVWRFKAPVAFLKFKILTSTTGGTQSKLETIESLRYQFMSNIFIGMKLLVLAIAPPESQSDSCPW